MIGSIYKPSLATLILICYKKKSYKEQNRWQLSRVNIDHRLDSCGAPRGQDFYMFNMKEYPNV